MQQDIKKIYNNDTLVYGVKDGKFVNINDAERGQKCGCICPYCKDMLIAKKGDTKAWHFSHKNISNASHPGSYQTQLHLMAKEIFEKIDYFYVPRINSSFSEPQKINIKHVILEQEDNGMIPDIKIIDENGVEYLVEIYVTHKVSDEKLKMLNAQKRFCLEINLSKYDREISEKELTNCLINDIQNKKWISVGYKKTNIQKFIPQPTIPREKQKLFYRRTSFRGARHF